MLQKIKDFLLEVFWVFTWFFKSTLFKRFLWNTLAWVLAAAWLYLAELPMWYALLLAPAINNLTKEVNAYISSHYEK
jgi:hypothetical protein